LPAAPSWQGSPQPCGQDTKNPMHLQEPGRTASGQAAELLNVSERSVYTASRVLKSADEQVIAAVESGDVAVSDAASIADLPKDEQRQALASKRQGRARTLRQAAEQLGDGSVPPQDGQAGGTPAPQSSRQRLLSEGKRFGRDVEKLLRRLDGFTAACGGPNDYTSHIHDCLTVLLRTVQECLKHFLSVTK
ncbi:MAG: hypothetical protein ACREHD_22500, partial [Pirellulales bacterium]